MAPPETVGVSQAPSVLAPVGVGTMWRAQPPPCLADLHLDDVIEAVTDASNELQRSVWNTPCDDLTVLDFRQAVVADLLRPDLRDAVQAFVDAVSRERRTAESSRLLAFRLPADLGRAESIARFADEMSTAAERLAVLDPGSAGLKQLATHLVAYTVSDDFRQLAEGIDSVLAEVHGLEFELGIQGGTVWVGPRPDRGLWVDAIRETFARFRTGTSPGPALPQPPKRFMNRVEAHVLDLVAQLFPDPVQRLRDFVAAHQDVVPVALWQLAEELRFYLDYLRMMRSLERAGVRFTVPHLQDDADGPFRVTDMVDVALALGVRSSTAPLVANDLVIAPSEKVVFITGPNQGGKTTFARTVGQVAYLASLGLPVPASSATLPLLGTVLTHFPRPDDPEHDRGGLADEMVRLRAVVDAAGPNALLILNELFSATSAEDAVGLSALILDRFEALGCRVLWVTFLEDLVTSVPSALSLVGQVDPDEPTRPTLRFRAQPPVNRSHAVALAARHGLSSADLDLRLP